MERFNFFLCSIGLILITFTFYIDASHHCGIRTQTTQFRVADVNEDLYGFVRIWQRTCIRANYDQHGVELGTAVPFFCDASGTKGGECLCMDGSPQSKENPCPVTAIEVTDSVPVRSFLDFDGDTCRDRNNIGGFNPLSSDSHKFKFYEYYQEFKIQHIKEKGEDPKPYPTHGYKFNSTNIERLQCLNNIKQTADQDDIDGHLVVNLEFNLRRFVGLGNKMPSSPIWKDVPLVFKQLAWKDTSHPDVLVVPNVPFDFESNLDDIKCSIPDNEFETGITNNDFFEQKNNCNFYFKQSSNKRDGVTSDATYALQLKAANEYGSAVWDFILQVPVGEVGDFVPRCQQLGQSIDGTYPFVQRSKLTNDFTTDYHLIKKNGGDVKFWFKDSHAGVEIVKPGSVFDSTNDVAENIDSSENTVLSVQYGSPISSSHHRLVNVHVAYQNSDVWGLCTLDLLDDCIYCPDKSECDQPSFECQCMDGYDYCGTDHFEEGCQTYIAGDVQNCGRCNNDCSTGWKADPEDEIANLTCANGFCEINQCKNSNWEPCEINHNFKRCADVQNDEQNCGTCGNICGNNEKCENGECRCKHNFVLGSHGCQTPDVHYCTPHKNNPLGVVDEDTAYSCYTRNDEEKKNSEFSSSNTKIEVEHNSESSGPETKWWDCVNMECKCLTCECRDDTNPELINNITSIADTCVGKDICCIDRNPHDGIGKKEDTCSTQTKICQNQLYNDPDVISSEKFEEEVKVLFENNLGVCECALPFVLNDKQQCVEPSDQFCYNPDNEPCEMETNVGSKNCRDGNRVCKQNETDPIGFPTQQNGFTDRLYFNVEWSFCECANCTAKDGSCVNFGDNKCCGENRNNCEDNQVKPTNEFDIYGCFDGICTCEDNDNYHVCEIPNLKRQEPIEYKKECLPKGSDFCCGSKKESCSGSTRCAPNGKGDYTCQACNGLLQNCEQTHENTDCEVNLSSVEHCGECNANCGQATNKDLEDVQCGLDFRCESCEEGMGNCDKIENCETPLDTTDNCGSCFNSCPNNTICGGFKDEGCICEQGYKTCVLDHGIFIEVTHEKNTIYPNDTPWCEIHTETAWNHCGECGIQCNRYEQCIDGQCQPCTNLFADCDDVRDTSSNVNVCNDTLSGSTSEYCGTCGRKCSDKSSCSSQGICVCELPLATCGGGEECGINLDSSAEHCGACNVNCLDKRDKDSSYTGLCEKGICTRCGSDVVDCDFDGTCETKLGTTQNCTACGDDCNDDSIYQYGINGGRCEFIPSQEQFSCSSCESKPGHFGNCDKDSGDSFTIGCETNLDRNPKHCGRCELECDTGLSCIAGICRCPTGEVFCPKSKQCVSDFTSNQHCGSCEKSCTNGQVCSDGECICSDPNKQDCGQGCTVDKLDRNNCGSCGNVCQSDNEFCEDNLNEGYSCKSCPEGQFDCNHDGQCSVPSLVTGCGSCGNRCGSNEICSFDKKNQLYECVCASGFEKCGDKCVKIGDNEKYCFCDSETNIPESCDETSTCRNGVCKCPPSFTACDNGGVEECTQIFIDPNNCGGCGKQCSAGEACVRGRCECLCEKNNACVDINSAETCASNCDNSLQNCTATQQICEDGTCVNCLSTEIICDNQCIIANSNDQCGSDCGSLEKCPRGSSCNANAHGDYSCVCSGSDFEICDNNCVNTLIEHNHCGNCGNVCDVNAFCEEGQCVCKDSYALANDSKTCVLLGTNDNCKFIGNDCEDGYCQNSKCKSCKDQVDDLFCGTCENTCDTAYGEHCFDVAESIGCYCSHPETGKYDNTHGTCDDSFIPCSVDITDYNHCGPNCDDCSLLLDTTCQLNVELNKYQCMNCTGKTPTFCNGACVSGNETDACGDSCVQCSSGYVCENRQCVCNGVECDGKCFGEDILDCRCKDYPNSIQVKVCLNSTENCKNQCYNVLTDNQACGLSIKYASADLVNQKIIQNRGGVCSDNTKCDNGTCVCDGISGDVCETEFFDENPSWPSQAICVDTQTNGDYCGSCEEQCDFNQTCTNGECLYCGNGTKLCDTGDANRFCLNITDASDSNNCGDCGVVCPHTHTCVIGSQGNPQCECANSDFTSNDNCGFCGNVCESPLTCLIGAGADGIYECQCPSNDFSTDDNCGTCGNVCEENYSCEGSPGNYLCECTLDITTDENCGFCGNDCGEGGICVKNFGGQYECTCPQDHWDSCGYEEKCTHLVSMNDCGDCGNQCGNEQYCDIDSDNIKCSNCPDEMANCAGISGDDSTACIDSLISDINCGECNNACDSSQGEICGKTDDNEISCICGAQGWTLCGDKCIRTDVSDDNCGGCGIVCSDQQSCFDGECAPCSQGSVNCRRYNFPFVPDQEQFEPDGCEAFLDSNNCGTCENVCNSDRICEINPTNGAGECICVGPNSIECEGNCTALGTQENCKACGDKCNALERCDHGVGCVCIEGISRLCGGKCVELDSLECCEDENTNCDKTEKCLPNLDGSGRCVCDPVACESTGGACISGECINTCNGVKCDESKGFVCNNGDCVCKESSNTICNGECIDFEIDNDKYCGSCDNDCTLSNTVCVEGECVCNEKGHCQENQICESGECVCMTGYEDCDEIASNGCESQLNTRNHCGSCNNSCDIRQGRQCIQILETEGSPGRRKYECRDCSIKASQEACSHIRGCNCIAPTFSSDCVACCSETICHSQ